MTVIETSRPSVLTCSVKLSRSFRLKFGARYVFKIYLPILTLQILSYLPFDTLKAVYEVSRDLNSMTRPHLVRRKISSYPLQGLFTLTRTLNPDLTTVRDVVFRMPRHLDLYVEEKCGQEPHKYTDDVFAWEGYSPRLSDIDNIELFRHQQRQSGAGRPGYFCRTREYAQWERKRADLLRHSKRSLAECWNFERRQFPFSKSENRIWKQKKVERGRSAERGESSTARRAFSISPPPKHYALLAAAHELDDDRGGIDMRRAFSGMTLGGDRSDRNDRRSRRHSRQRSEGAVEAMRSPNTTTPHSRGSPMHPSSLPASSMPLSPRQRLLPANADFHLSIPEDTIDDLRSSPGLRIGGAELADLAFRRAFHNHPFVTPAQLSPFRGRSPRADRSPSRQAIRADGSPSRTREIALREESRQVVQPASSFAAREILSRFMASPNYRILRFPPVLRSNERKQLHRLCAMLTAQNETTDGLGGITLRSVSFGEGRDRFLVVVKVGSVRSQRIVPISDLELEEYRGRPRNRGRRGSGSRTRELERSISPTVGRSPLQNAES